MFVKSDGLWVVVELIPVSEHLYEKIIWDIQNMALRRLVFINLCDIAGLAITFVWGSAKVLVQRFVNCVSALYINHVAVVDILLGQPALASHCVSQGYSEMSLQVFG
jgi:hypothetical protein